MRLYLIRAGSSMSHSNRRSEPCYPRTLEALGPSGAERRGGRPIWAAASAARRERQGSRAVPRLSAVSIISILPLSYVAQAILGDFRKGRRRFIETSRNFGELLPAPEDDIAPSRIVFDEVGATPGALGRDHGGARTRERIEHAIAACGAILESVDQECHRLPAGAPIRVPISPRIVPDVRAMPRSAPKLRGRLDGCAAGNREHGHPGRNVIDRVRRA